MANRVSLRDRERRLQAWSRENLRILKAVQGCADCGTHDGQLCHHHVDPSTKKRDVSTTCGRSFEMFVEEVAKCTVLCRSCHKKRHDKLRRQ